MELFKGRIANDPDLTDMSMSKKFKKMSFFLFITKFLLLIKLYLIKLGSSFINNVSCGTKHAFRRYRRGCGTINQLGNIT